MSEESKKIADQKPPHPDKVTPVTDNEFEGVMSREAAKYRGARNKALKELHAAKAVLKGHNIPFDPDAGKLDKLTIKDGVVEGEFEYNKPKIEPVVQKSSRASGDGDASVLTRDDLKKLSPEEINSRWDEVKDVLKKG